MKLIAISDSSRIDWTTPDVFGKTCQESIRQLSFDAGITRRHAGFVDIGSNTSELRDFVGFTSCRALESRVMGDNNLRSRSRECRILLTLEAGFRERKTRFLLRPRDWAYVNFDRAGATQPRATQVVASRSWRGARHAEGTGADPPVVARVPQHWCCLDEGNPY